MLCEASVGEVKRDRIGAGKVVVCMRYYPRYLKKELVQDYHRELAPDEVLFADFRASLEKSGDHNLAFESVGYENRFSLSDKGFERLAEISELSRKQDVYLVCQCERGQKCHRHLLLLIAEKYFGAQIDRVRLPYPDFATRLEAGLKPLYG